MSLLGIVGIDLPAGQWTAINIPALVSGARYKYALALVMHNRSNQSLRMRSDPDDPDTEDSLDALAQEAVGDTKFTGLPGSLIIWMQPSGNANSKLILRFTAA